MKTAKPTTPTTTPTPRAYSYLRFSADEQRKGDSVRRQSALRDDWLSRNPTVPLDTTLASSDFGKSAFSKKRRPKEEDDGMAGMLELEDLVNPDRRALMGFLEAIRLRKIPRGSYLLIENLDRLSRDDVVPAMSLLTGILSSGIKVVVFKPSEIVLEDGADPMKLMMAVMELSRGNSESKAKSFRLKENADEKVRLATEGKTMPPRKKDGRVTKAITSRLPSWIEDRDGVLCRIEERATVVRRIFEMVTAENRGANAIVKKLNAEKVRPFGDRVKDEEGRFRKVEGERYGCGEWRTSYVRSILKDRRALGEYLPRDADGRKKGDPIPGYYPAVVTEDEFYAARAAVLGRKNKPGRIGNGVANLFGGLLLNARDGSTYYGATRTENGGVSKVLLNKTSIEGRSKAFTFPYETFERAILSELRELDPAKVLGRSEPADAALLLGELGRVRERKTDLAAELLNGDVAAIGDALRKLEKRERELETELGEAEDRAVKPLEDTWRDAKTLIEMLDTVPPEEREDLRLRLRAALRRMISSIWLVVVPRGRDRLCEARVFFAGGSGKKGYRNYLIFRRRPNVNAVSRDPGGWAVLSSKYPEEPFTGAPSDDGEFGFGILDWGSSAVSFLESYPAEMIAKLTKKNPL